MHLHSSSRILNTGIQYLPVDSIQTSNVPLETNHFLHSIKSSVKVKKEEREGSRMKGRASVVIDDGLAIHNIRIIEGKKGLFIAMPSTSKEVENEDGETVTVHRDTVHPINQEVRTMFEEEILKEYEATE